MTENQYKSPDATIIDAPKPEGDNKRRAFVYFNGRITIPIVVPECTGLLDAIKIAKPYGEDDLKGLWIVTFCWLEKCDGKKGWFPPMNWERPDIRELADLMDGVWVP